MKWLKTSIIPFYFLMIAGLCVLLLTFYDVVYDKGWIYVLLAVYAILIILAIFLILLRFQKQKPSIDTVEEFEKSLKGGLFHFKCPTCSGIFAIKKSKSNDKKVIKMTCPDCGAIGIIPIKPFYIEQEIPEKKSKKANFKCINCGEGVTIWAEGTDLREDLKVYICPFCGEEETMNKI